MADPELQVRSDLIEVVANIEEDVAADGVDIQVSVDGSSLFTGRAALSKAREVHQLVEALAQVGVPENQIFVEGIRATTTSGIFSKSSSAHYSLRVRTNCTADSLEPHACTSALDSGLGEHEKLFTRAFGPSGIHICTVQQGAPNEG